MNNLNRFIFVLTIYFLILFLNSCSGNNELTFQLVHHENDKINNLSPAEAKIDQSQYQCFTKDNQNYWVNKNIELDLSDIKDARFKVMIPQCVYEEKINEEEIAADTFSRDNKENDITGNGYTVTIYFNKKGQKKLEELTEKNMKRQLAIMIKGQFLMAPVIMEKVSGAEISVAGITFNDAKQLRDAICQSSSRCKRKADGQSYLSQKSCDAEKVINFLKKEIEKDPQNPLYYEGIGSTYKNKGDLQEALSYFNKAIELNSKNETVYHERGLTYQKLGNNIEAIKDYSKAIELSKSKGNDFPSEYLSCIYFDRAFAYGNIGKYSEAINDCNTVIDFNPRNALAYNNRGSYYYALGNYSQATKDYDKAIELNPNYADSYFGRGSANKDKQQAIKDFDKAIELNAKHANAYYNRAKAYYELHNYKQAINDYDKSIEFDPKQADIYVGRGSSYQNLNNYKQAIENYNEAIKINPKYSMAYYNRGIVYLLQGKNNLGCRDAKKTCELGNCTLLKSAKEQGVCR